MPIISFVGDDYVAFTDTEGVGWATNLYVGFKGGLIVKGESPVFKFDNASRVFNVDYVDLGFFYGGAVGDPGKRIFPVNFK